MIVQKFGGTSVSDIKKIEHVADIIYEKKSSKIPVIVVVSAMSGTTNQLLTYFLKYSFKNSYREHDALLSTGENIVTALLSVILNHKGIKAKAFQGWQVPIYTDSNYSRAKITKINKSKINECLLNEIVPVISGFQGVYKDNITTFGRNGSDITAAALAAAFSADYCNIYTDVDGVHTTDPRLVKNVGIINKISYEEMLEMSHSGAKVLHPRAISIAMRYNIPIKVMSSFSRNKGTLITNINMEKLQIKSITVNNDIAFCQIICDKDCSKDIKKIIDIISEINNSYYYISNNKIEFTFILTKAKEIEKQLSSYQYNILTQIAMISIIGHGLNDDLSILKKAYNVFENAKINVLCSYNATNKFSFIINQNKLDKAVILLHKLFDLHV